MQQQNKEMQIRLDRYRWILKRESTIKRSFTYQMRIIRSKIQKNRYKNTKNKYQKNYNVLDTKLWSNTKKKTK